MGVAAVLVLASCDSPSPGEPPTPSPTGTTEAGVQDLDCANPIWAGPGGTENTSGRGVPGLMALTFSGDMLQWHEGNADDAGLHFQKTGLALRVDRPLQIAVPATLRGEAKISWGTNSQQPTGTLRIRGCPAPGPEDDWVVYPGGVWMAKPQCLPLEVSSTGGKTTVDIPVGAPCP